MRNVRLVILCLAGAVAACGQKGPLVLPEAQHTHKKIVVRKPPAPAAATPPQTPSTPATPQPQQ